MQTTDQRSKVPVLRLIVLMLLLTVGFINPRIAAAAQTVCADFVQYCTANGGTSFTVTISGKESPACDCSNSPDPWVCSIGEVLTCIFNCEPIQNVTVLNQAVACVPLNQ